MSLQPVTRRASARCRGRRWRLGAALLTAGTLLLGAPAKTAELDAAATAAEAPEQRYVVHEFDWHDARRDRLVPVRLYLPDAATPAKPVPLVVFSHGIGGSRQGYSHLGRFWAGQGYASLHLQHTGSDRALWVGNPFDLLSRLQAAAQEQEAIARVRDLSFALDQVLASGFGPRLDAQRIIAAGHSYGANTTLLAAGAQVRRDGRVLDLGDRRIRAAIVLSAPPFYGEASPAQVLRSVRVPTLHVTTTDDVIRIPGYYSGAEDRVAVFEAVGGPSKTLAVFAGGSHSVFTDRTATGGALLNPQIKQATRELSLAFLKSVLGGDERPLRDWPGQYGGLVARYTHQRL